MTNLTSRIIRFAAAHGFQATACDDGAAIITIPYVNRSGREGVGAFVVSTFDEAREALGY